MKNKIFISFFVIFFAACSSFGLEAKTLPNGQTVIVEQIKNNPIVIIDTWVKTGSINEDDSNTGVSHFLEHLLFKGSKNHSTGEFDRILESKGGLINAATSKDFTHFYIQLPSKDFDTAIEMHADMLLRPTIPMDELEKERLVVIEEISKNLDSPDRTVYENLVKNLYLVHPYKRKVIGTKEVIQNISRDDIFKYYNKFYIPQNMVTVIVGDVDTDYAIKKVQENFKATPIKLRKKINKKEKPINKEIVDYIYDDINTGYMIIGFHTPEAKSSENYALDVLSTILGDGKTSVLYKEIKEKKQLAFNISASNSSYKETGIFTIDANFVPQNTEKIRQAVFSEIKKIGDKGVSQTQLDTAKKIIINDINYSKESVSSIASQIGYTEILTDGIKYYKEYIDNINKVTLDDIKKVTNKYLTQNKSVTSVLLPNNTSIENTSTIKNHTYKLTETKNGINKYILDNNATLIINKNTYNDIVSFCIFAKGGYFQEEIPSTSNLLASVLLKGTKNYSKEELAQIMEENGIKISFSSASDAFEIDVTTLKNQLPKTFEILDELVNNALISDNEIEKAKENTLNRIKKSKDVPMSIALEGFREKIYGNSPYSVADSRFLNNYKKIKRQNLVDYYNKIFSAQNITISINGNVDITDVVNPISEIFKQTNKDFSYSDYNIPTINKPIKVTNKIKDLSTTWIFTGWQVCGLQNTKDYAALSVIDSLLGSGMSSRLFVNLREKHGLAYQIGSSYSPKILKGAFIMYIGTNPKTADKSLTMLMNEIKRLKIETVDEKELQEAKDKIIGRYIMSQESNLDKASQIGWYDFTQRGIDFGDKYEKIINSVTPEDIKRVANKYFTDNNILSIVDIKE